MPEDSPPDFLVLYATRYALGRRSYSVGEVVGWLKDNWGSISDNTKVTIRKDIEARIQRGSRLPEDHPLGDSCDRKQWEQILEMTQGITPTQQ